MKPILKQILISAISAVAGGLIVFGALKLSSSSRVKMSGEHPAYHSREDIFDEIFKKQDGIRSQFDNLFNDDFFSQGDPFDQMRKMREQMEKHIGSLVRPPRSSWSNPFDSWFSEKFGGTVNDISKREDDDFVYYDIKVENLNSTSIQTKIENGYITITGITETKSDTSDEKNKNGSSAQSVYKSAFERTFPLPEKVDASKMQMTAEKNKIVLRFQKIKT